MKENRNKRKQILITRTLEERAQELCRTNQISFNELVNQALNLFVTTPIILNRRK